MQKNEKAKIIGKAIGMIYGSLESHLLTPYYGKRKDLFEKDNKFHQQCVREYAEIIYLISQLY